MFSIHVETKKRNAYPLREHRRIPLFQHFFQFLVGGRPTGWKEQSPPPFFKLLTKPGHVVFITWLTFKARETAKT